MRHMHDKKQHLILFIQNKLVTTYPVSLWRMLKTQRKYQFLESKMSHSYNKRAISAKEHVLYISSL